MTRNDLEIITKRIDDIVVNPTNPKIHTADQVEQIKKSILNFGFNDPIAVDENNFLIEGHGRLLAAQELGYEEVPAIVLSGLTEEERTAYALIHNQLTMTSDFEYGILKKELEDLQDIDMSQYSFEIHPEEYFDEAVDGEGAPKIIVKTSEISKADMLEDFLSTNNYKFKRS